MVKKERVVPLKLQMEDALYRRLSASHPKHKELTVQLKKGWAGYRGEQNLDYELGFLPSSYLIFQDLRLPLHERTFQIDTLILTPHMAVIIETKNIYGTLFFDSTSKQVIRTFENITEGFPDPLLQAKKQQFLFQQWLIEHQIRPMEIHYLVAIGSPNTIIKTDNPKIYEKVLHAAHIPDKLLELDEVTKNNPFTKPLSHYFLEKITKNLVSEHSVNIPDILKRYSIQPPDIIKGVICPECGRPGMNRVFGSWTCPECGHHSKIAHQQATMDYLLLFHSISNEECRHFLHVDSSHTVKRLLASMELPTAGVYKGKKYLLPV